MSRPRPGQIRPLQQLQTVANFIETPSLARIYAHTERAGPVTVGGLVEELAIPQGTAYDYVDRLEAAGLLEQVNDTRPYRYAAPEIALTLSTADTTTTVTPALVAAIALVEDDGDVERFVDRHGLDGLAEALEYAHERAEGSVTHRMMARETACSPVEAEVILQALEPVVKRYGDPRE